MAMVMHGNDSQYQNRTLHAVSFKFDTSSMLRAAATTSPRFDMMQPLTACSCQPAHRWRSFRNTSSVSTRMTSSSLVPQHIVTKADSMRLFLRHSRYAKNTLMLHMLKKKICSSSARNPRKGVPESMTRSNNLVVLGTCYNKSRLQLFSAPGGLGAICQSQVRMSWRWETSRFRI